ncbi:hypothetical protein L7F22_036243 [Adiantum nelumboides]|nr:hypothetical protein [Adiantum nelumboides]
MIQGSFGQGKCYLLGNFVGARFGAVMLPNFTKTGGLLLDTDVIGLLWLKNADPRDETNADLMAAPAVENADLMGLLWLKNADMSDEKNADLIIRGDEKNADLRDEKNADLMVLLWLKNTDLMDEQNTDLIVLLWLKNADLMDEKNANLMDGNLEQVRMHLGFAAHHGIPRTSSRLAYDPAQRLLAIGTLDGKIKLIGDNGVEGILVSASQSRCKYLEFANNQGFLVHVTSENDLQIWDLERRELMQTHRWHTDVTAFAMMQGSPFMYIGEDSGDIAVLEYDREQKTLCQMPYYIPIQVTREIRTKLNCSASVIGILPYPETVHSRVLIAYSDGVIVVWSVFDAQIKDIRIVSGKNQQEEELSSDGDNEDEEKDICCTCWADSSGNLLAIGYTDGDIWLWDLAPSSSKSSRESNVPLAKLQLSSDNLRSPVLALRWCAGGGREAAASVGGHLFVYGGGGFDCSEVFTVCSLKTASGQSGMPNVHHVDIPLEGLFEDMILLSGPGATFFDQAAALLVLTSHGKLHAYDEASITRCLEPNEKSSTPSLPEPVPINPFTTEPSVTVTVLAELPADGKAADILSQLPRQFRGNLPTVLPGGTKWPVTGGVISQCSEQRSKVSAVLVTGHADGSVNVWDASTSVFSQLCNLPAIISPKLQQSTTGLGVSHMNFCSRRGVLLVARGSSVVSVYKVSAESGEARLTLWQASEIQGELLSKNGDDDHRIELILGSSPPNKPPSQAQQKEIISQVNELVQKGMDVGFRHGKEAIEAPKRMLEAGVVGKKGKMIEFEEAHKRMDQQFYQSAGFQCVAILNTGLAVTSISISNYYEHVAVGHIDGTVSVLDVACATLMVQRKEVFLNEQKHVRCLAFGTGVKVSAPSDSTTGTASFLRGVLYAAEDSAFAALLYDNGDVSSCGPWHVDDSRILYMHCQEIFNVQKAEGRIGPSADQSSENLLDKGRHPEEADLCSHCLLVCTQVSAFLYHCAVSNKVATLSSLKTARFQMPCSSASTFFCQSANARRLALLNNAATLEVRSLPGLDVVQQFSMAGIYNLDPKVNENPTLVCGDQGLMALVDVKREIIMFAVLSGDENLRTGDQLVSFFDKEVAAAGEAALKAGSLPSRRKSQLQGLIGGVLKDLKVGGVLKEIKGGLLKSSKSGKELSMEVQSPDYLSKVFILPLSTNNSGSPQLVRASQAEVADSAPELDIDDIEIEDEEAIKPGASEKAAKSKGKEKVSDPADDRRKLFDGDDDHNKPVRRSPDEIRAKYGHKPLGDVSGAAGLARDKLLERQEKLQALGKRTEEMQEGAQNFASMAAELAKTMEGRKWWQL